MPRGIPRAREEDRADTVEVSSRATETRRERRRRDDGSLDAGARMKLAIPIEIREKMEREGKTLRWVRDDAGRMQQLHNEDWDKVEGVDTVAASRTEPGQMVLMAKDKDWYRDDRAHLTETNNANEKLAASGNAQGVSTEGMYVPTGTKNRISRGV